MERIKISPPKELNLILSRTGSTLTDSQFNARYISSEFSRYRDNTEGIMPFATHSPPPTPSFSSRRFSRVEVKSRRSLLNERT